jgi:hypothetical protein
MLVGFMAGGQRVIVATSALGMGVDTGHLIHYSRRLAADDTYWITRKRAAEQGEMGCGAERVSCPLYQPYRCIYP